MDKKLLALYSDYLLSSFGATTATGLSSLLDGQISHDQVTRFLSQAEYTSKELWHQVKIRSAHHRAGKDGVLIFDDTIQQKPHTDENELICWHFDHSTNRSVKGLNLLNCIYQAGDVSVPVAYELVRKTDSVLRSANASGQTQKRGEQKTNCCGRCCAPASTIACATAMCWPIVGFRPRKICCVSAKT